MSDYPIETGSAAPDVTLQGEHVEPVALSELWTKAERGVVLSFLRHYG